MTRVYIKYTRRIPTTIQSGVRKHGKRIGDITIIANLLQEAFFHLFWIVIGDHEDATYEMVHGVWHTIMSDKTQRDMLEAATIGRFGPNSRFAQQIKWAIGRAGKLSEFRNDIVHTPVRFAVIDEKPILLFQRVSAKKASMDRLAKTPAATQSRLVRGDLVVLTVFCETLYRVYLLNGQTGPWPRRPPLLSLPKTSQRRGRRKQGGQRKRQPRPSS
jgi:hypothetical protein